MKKIGEKTLGNIEEFMKKDARPLEREMFEFYFKNGSKAKIAAELKAFQNGDGGFAGLLEPDCRLPLSTPLASSIALRIIRDFGLYEESADMREKVYGYLDASYDERRKGWYSVCREINDYPHAPWWDFDTAAGMTVIDNFWGNPTAEIIGYVYSDDGYAGKLDKFELLKNAADYWNLKEEYKSEHEMMCFIRLFNMLPEESRAPLRHGIIRGISELLNMNVEEWNGYVPRPLDFIFEKHGEHFGITEKQIDKHLDFVADEINQYGIIRPNWQWGVYPQEWENAKREWTGVKTLEFLIAADKFGRVCR